MGGRTHFRLAWTEPLKLPVDEFYLFSVYGEREREREREGASEAEKGNLGVTFSANITCQTAYKTNGRQNALQTCLDRTSEASRG
jgi:hypothetical protein